MIAELPLAATAADPVVETLPTAEVICWPVAVTVTLPPVETVHTSLGRRDHEPGR